MAFNYPCPNTCEPNRIPPLKFSSSFINECSISKVSIRLENITVLFLSAVVYTESSMLTLVTGTILNAEILIPIQNFGFRGIEGNRTIRVTQLECLDTGTEETCEEVKPSARCLLSLALARGTQRTPRPTGTFVVMHSSGWNRCASAV